MANKLLTISDNAWLRVVKLSIASGMLFGMAMSYHLWIGDRLLPAVPVLKINSPGWVGVACVAVFVAALVVMLGSTRRVGPAVVILSGAALIFLDQLRFQPWVYLYLLLLMPFALGRMDRSTISAFYLIVIAGVYAWSGAHKLNTHFLDGNYATNVEFFFGYKINGQQGVVRALGYCVGAAELAIGIGLLFGRTRRLAIIGAILMHILIIIFLAFQQAVGDSIVVPWNLAMISLVVVTFYPLRQPFKNLHSLSLEGKGILGFGVLLIWICPVLNIFDRWDHFPSFSLYSNKVSMFYVAIQQDELDKIDPRLRKYFVQLPGMAGGQLLDVHWWSEDELHVPFYPERRVFVGLSSYFCGLGIPEERIVFLELMSGNSKVPVINSFQCSSAGE